jgi:hypothetical protein
MQLLIDPLVDAECCYTLDVTGARSKGQAVERVQGALLLVHLDSGRIPLILFGDGELKGKCKSDTGYGYKENDLSSQETHLEFA